MPNANYTKKCKNRRPVTLEQMQAAVEGNIEVLPAKPGILPFPIVMVINETGKFKFEKNKIATGTARLYGMILPNDYIAGPALVLREENGNFYEFSDEESDVIDDILASLMKAN